jgi:membrane associated rhomboid family serine protease
MRRPPQWTEAYHYPATAGTWLLAVAVTVAMWAKVDVSPLLEGPQIAHGQLWRLITSALPHADPIHLLFNLYWLWTFGTLVEQQFGAVRTFALYAFLAAGSAAAEYALLDGGIGLSGVGYGLFGMLWVLSRREPERFGDAVDSRTIQLFVAWFFVCQGLTIVGVWHVAKVAHSAGALLGALIGWILTTRFESARLSWVVRATPLLALAVLVLACTLGRRYVNVSPYRGLHEAQLGYDALVEHHDADAVRWLLDATAMKPDDADHWFNLGIAYHRLHDTRRATDAYARAARLEPNNNKFRAAVDEMTSYLEAMDSPAAAAARNATTMPLLVGPQPGSEQEQEQ